MAGGAADVISPPYDAGRLALALDRASGRAEELASARARLESGERIAVASRFAQAVVHEIGNPLSALALSASDLSEYSAEVTALWRTALQVAEQLRREPESETVSEACARALLGDPHRAVMLAEIPAIIADVLEGTRRIAEMAAGFASLGELPNVEPVLATPTLDAIVREALAQA